MTYDTGEREPRAGRWAGLLTLPLLLVVGWVLYELTAQPALGVAAVCVKFGWEDFRTAFWLRRSDPQRRRAAACFWLYTASGLWKVAITASLMIFAYICLKLFGALGRQAIFHAAGAIVTAFTGIVLAALAACWAVIRAWHSGVRMWLNPALHAARRNDLWPPTRRPLGRVNVAGLLLGTSLFAVLEPLACYGLVVGVFVGIGAPFRGADHAALALLVGLPGQALLLALALNHLVRRRIGSRVFAANPGDCWNRGAIEEKPTPAYVGDEVAASRNVPTWGAPEVASD